MKKEGSRLYQVQECVGAERIRDGKCGLAETVENILLKCDAK